MVIDVHVHPAFYGPICEDPQRVDTRKKVMGYDLMSPFPLELVEKQMAFAGVDKLVLLGEDCAAEGGAVLSNEEVSRLVSLDPSRRHAEAARPEAASVQAAVLPQRPKAVPHL